MGVWCYNMKSSIFDKLLDVINVVVMLIILVICVYPLYYILIYSISSPQEAAKGLILLPRGVTFLNYIQVFKSGDIINGFIISALRAIVGTLFTVIGSSAIAYLVTKKELPFRKVIYRFMIITMYLNAGLIPWYMMMVTYNLKNNFLLYVIPGIINVFSVVLIKTYIEEAISPSLEESAQIDGAGLFVIFFKLILPLSLPILAAIAVFSAVGQWNSWTDNLFLVSNQKLKTLQLMLYEYITSAVPTASNIKDISAQMSNYKPTANAVRMTVSMITIIPISLIYPFLQKYFVKGLMVGAIKG